MNKFFNKLFTSAVLFFSFNSVAAQISPQQMQMFKSLPLAQQQAMAAQFGIDLNSLKKSNQKVEETEVVETQRQPRITDIANNNQAEDDGLLDTTLKPFGYEVFANEPSGFIPDQNIAVPDDYLISVGDELDIQMFGKENQSYQLVVSREGKILIPILGPFQVAGLTFGEVKQYLSNQIKERVIGVDLVVSLTNLRSIRIFVLGDAYLPGPYTVSSLSTITHAIFAAGGINDIGSLRNIQLKRAGKLITTFDLYDLLINGDSSNDLPLKTGDVVFIPPKGKTVSVAGEVRRPAIYELTTKENLETVLKMAGGILPTAYQESVTVERYQQGARSVINLNLNNNLTYQQPIVDGDFIHIMQKSEIFSDTVTLIGAVTRPGQYEWRDGIKISDIIKNIDTSVLQHADLTYGLIVREIDLARNIEIHQFSLANALSNKNSVDNLLLKSRDKVLVFSNLEKKSEQYLTLETMAHTEDTLFLNAKQKAKTEFQDEAFWQKYGAMDKQLTELIDSNSSISELYKNSANDALSNIVDESTKVDLRQWSVFSRQRLLLPIIEQLKRQGSSGKPIQLVEIDGQVKYPGIYPLPVNGKVSDIVAAAGGVTESAYLARLDITRNTISELQADKQTLQVVLSEALNKQEQANILLKSKDRLNVHQIPAWQENNTVELTGEFVFPGKYTIQRGETLAQLIKRAGGFTEFADINGSVFSREKLKELEANNIQKLVADLRVEVATKSLTSETNNTPYSEAKGLLDDLAKVQPVGRLVIDLAKVIHEDAYDVLLESGDVLYIPTQKNSINVIGQVQVTTSHIYDAELSVEDYIFQSGGIKKRADEERIYIVAANGSIRMLDNSSWFSTDGMQVQPGDTIVVPLDGEYMNNLTLWQAATQILYNSAVAIAAISRI